MRHPSLIPSFWASAFLMVSSPVRAGDPPPFRTARTVHTTGYGALSRRTFDVVVEIDDAPATIQIEVPEKVGHVQHSAKKVDRRGRMERGAASAEPVLMASFSEAAARSRWPAWLPSLELVGQKGKFFDDGLMAALELAIEKGIMVERGKKEIDGGFVGTRKWLHGMCNALKAKLGTAPKEEAAGYRRALQFLATAFVLGGHPIQDLKVDREMSKALARSARRFIRDDRLNSTPTSFHSWNKTLERIFRETRWLMTMFNAGDPGDLALLSALMKVLQENGDLTGGLDFLLSFNAALTNPSRGPSILDLLVKGRPAPSGKVSLLPLAQSKEVDFLMGAGASGLKPGEAMKAFIARVKDGSLSLRPGKNSGWYDHKQYAIEPFLMVDSLPEAKKLLLDDRYRRRLEAAFSSMLTQARETHDLRLMVGLPTPKEEVLRIHLDVTPEIAVEPIPTYFERLYNAYAFLEEKVLAAKLPRWEGIKPFRLGRPARTDLRTRLNDIKKLCLGLHLLSRKNLGLPPPDPAPSGSAEALSSASNWLTSLKKDPEMKQDIRVITPVLVTAEGRLLSWAVLGIRNIEVTVSYAKKPAVRVVTDIPAKVDLTVDFHKERRTISVPVFAEVLLPDARPMSREDFRKVCDRLRTPKAIVTALEKGLTD